MHLQFWVIPTNRRSTPASVKRTPIVKKKGKERGIFSFTSLCRGRKTGDEHSPASPGVGGSSLSAAAQGGRRGHVVMATPLRRARSSSFRGYSRSESLEITPGGRRSGTVFVRRWLLRMFATGRQKRKGPDRDVGGEPTASATAADNSNNNDDARSVDEAGGRSWSSSSIGTVRRVSLRKKSLTEERPCSVGACYSQFYDEPGSPAVMESGEKTGLGGGDSAAMAAAAAARRAVLRTPEGGARVQHLLRTSQLHMSLKSGSVSSELVTGLSSAAAAAVAVAK